MIKDKDGVPLKYGDTIRNVAGGRHGVHRFCYEYKGSAKGLNGSFAVVVNDSGVDFKIHAPNGILQNHVRLIDADDLRLVPESEWIVAKWDDGRQVLSCACCGSPIPVNTTVDFITKEDNHYCYFCGARMNGVSGEQ